MSNVTRGSFGTPPPPFPGLSDAEAATWTDTVDCWPAAYFKPSDLPLLAEYCRALATASELARNLDMARTVQEMKAVLDLRDREVRRAAALSRTLRIAPQSRYDRHATATKANATRGKRPWEDDGTDKFFKD